MVNILVSILLITTLPVLGAGITVLFFFFERQFGYSGLMRLAADSGGDPVAFQHLFWFFVIQRFMLLYYQLLELFLRHLKIFVSHRPQVIWEWCCFIFYWICRILCMSSSYVYCRNGRYYSNLCSCATLVIGVPTAVKIFAWSLALTEINFKDWSFVIVRTFISCFVFGSY